MLLVVFLLGVVSAFVEGTEWETFKQKHAKSYANPIEEVYRMKVITRLDLEPCSI